MANIPDFPIEARKAADEGRLIVFLGAGISCAAGLPGWDCVKQKLIGKCRLNEGEDERIKNEWKNMEFYKCFESIKQNDEPTYKNIIRQSLDLEQADINSYQKWLKIIKSWNPAAIITTNVDELLISSKLYNNSDFHYPPDFWPQEIRGKKIFFLHGIGEKSIWSFEEQRNIYGQDYFKIFLWNVFGSYCVFFIGTSFREQWLKFTEINYNRGKSYYHFALVPSNENVSKIELQDYYKIKVLAYNNDDGKYGYFKETIESWDLNKPNVIEPDIATTARSSP